MECTTCALKLQISIHKKIMMRRYCQLSIINPLNRQLRTWDNVRTISPDLASTI